MPAFLIVRLGALGDIVHALPVVDALRTAFPTARIDWLVDVRHRQLLEHATGLTTCVLIDTRRASGPTGVWPVVRSLRAVGYDTTVDLQGLIKSAVLARLSGAARVVGFGRAHLREPLAGAFYSESVDPGPSPHVVAKGLALAAAAGAAVAIPRFPLIVPRSPVPAATRASFGLGPEAPLVALNPGGAWPNKRWPAERFGQLAAALRAKTGLRSAVLWGPGEEALAQTVSQASNGAALVAPATTLADALALLASARLVVSGDTGPLHLAAAVGTPLVGIYGPTDPARNGPWSPADLVVSRSAQCQCFHQRRCHAERWCLLDVPVDEVVEAAIARLAARAEVNDDRIDSREPGNGWRP